MRIGWAKPPKSSDYSYINIKIEVVIIYKKILLALDNSADSKRAIEKVIDLYRKYQSEIVVFHTFSTVVVPQINIGIMNMNYYPTRLQSTAQIISTRKVAGEQLLKSTEEIFKKNSVPVTLRLVEDESPDEYILEAIEHEGFDLVILGCEGHHSKLRRVLFDTIPDKVLNKAPADILIVR